MMTEHNKVVLDAVSFLEGGKPAKALEILVSQKETLQKDPMANFYVAVSLDILSREKEAIRYYERAIELGLGGGLLFKALIGLGSSLRIEGELSRSIEVLTRAVEKFSDSPYSKLFRALSCYDAGEHQRTVSALFSLVEKGLLSEADPFYVPVKRYFAEISR